MTNPIDNSRPRAIGVLALILMMLGAAGIETSCTAPPHCPPGQHAERAPSHQGKVWECARVQS